MADELDFTTEEASTAGQVITVSVDYVSVTPDGPERGTTIDLPMMRAHCRPERIEDLVDDLTMLCEDVLARRQQGESGRPALAIIQGTK